MRRTPATLAVASLLVAGGIGLFFRQSRAPEPAASPGPAVVAAPAPRASGGPVFPASGPVEQTRGALEALRAELLAMPREEAVAWVRRGLADGADATTGLAFEIARDGRLAQWPTRRTFLLDVLAELDPEAAAAAGREVLERPTTADEWALALRNVARVGGDPAYLRARTEALITHPAWQADPSVGYLNAFDVLVHTGATASTPLLSSLVQRKDRRDLAHAGFLTLDRLVQRHPVEQLGLLAADEALRQSRPEMVAQQFARADVRQPDQQELLRAWLLDPRRTASELRAFAGVYPNHNRFISHNLLTLDDTHAGEDLADHDRQALRVLGAWQQDPAFAAVSEPLAAMVARLEGFVGSRSTPPPSE
jgi:hypothetical protein